MSEDITFCASDCSREECFRHYSHIQNHNILHSFAEFMGTKYCPYNKKNEFNTWLLQKHQVKGGKGTSYTKYVCSNCKRISRVKGAYCPNCGVRMSVRKEQ